MISQLEKDAELSAWYQLLVLFAYGTLATYKGPPLVSTTFTLCSC